MDLPRLYSLNARLKRHPPLRDMVQAYLGIQSPDTHPASKAAESGNTEKDLEEFIEMFRKAGGTVE